VTNSQSVQKYGVIPGGVFTVCSSTNSGINSMEFITFAAVPYILPLIQTELVNEGYQFACWKFHICNRWHERILCCSISSLIAANTDMTQDPTEGNCFAIASKTCVIFQDTVHKIQINLKPTQSFEARQSEKIMKFVSLLQQMRAIARETA